MTDDDRKILLAIAQRKLDAEDLCDLCNGTGRSAEEPVCSECLGQGVLLYEEEYEALLRLTGRSNDDILDADIIE